MRKLRNILILMAFIIPVLTGCSGGGSDTPPLGTFDKATFDKATFDNATWE